MCPKDVKLVIILRRTAVMFIVTSPAALASDARNDLAEWSSFNTRLSVAGAALHQSYNEIDSYRLTSDGLLNSEHGFVHGMEAGIRWQGTVSGIPAFAALTASYYKGPTQYDGYLQSSTGLTPFSNISGNEISTYHLQAGYPMPVQARLQIIPIVEIGHFDWTRSLTHYRERYRRAAIYFGAIAQYRRQRFSYEAQALVGRTIFSSVRVDEFSWAGELGTGRSAAARLGIHYSVSTRCRIGAQLQLFSLYSGLSFARDNLQQPASRTRQATVSVSIDRHY